MLHHDNYILFFVNIQAVVVFHHKKVKFTNCLLNAECIFVMAESDKTLIQDCNFSNNTPNNIVSSINPMPVGTIHSDTHPSHQVACEPSTLKRKQTSFQITSVTVKGSRLSTDGGEDSADDLDESHTEDANSENLDSSRTTDLDKEQMLEDNTSTNNDVALIPAPSIVSNVDLPIKQVNKPFDAPKNDPCENTQSDFVKPSNLPDQWQHRFKVVKIVSSEPFKRGRWLCLDFMDPPAPVTEAKAEIVESSSSNIQLIAKSLPDSIPSDKIAHIYEISPSDAYPGSISVAVGSDHAQQPMYGIFLPISNGQYPLITGMHSRAIPHSNETEVKSQETSQPSIKADLGIQPPKKLTPPLAQQQPSAINLQTNLNVLSNTQQSQSTISSNIQQQSQNVSNTLQQPLTIGLNVHQNAVSNIQQQQQQSDSRGQQQNVASVISQQGTTSTMHIQQNVPTNIQQQSHQQAQSVSSNVQQHVQNIGLQQNVSSCLQQTQNIQTNLQQSQLTTVNHSQAPTVSSSTIQHSQSISSTASQPQAVNMPSSNNSNVQQIQQASVNISQSQSGQSSNVQQSQFISSSTIPQPQQLPMNMQTMSGIHQSQQISSNLQQTQNLPHQQHAGLQQQQNVPTNEQQNISANPQQSVALNVPSPQHSITSVQKQTILSGQTVTTQVLQNPVDSEVCVGETLAFPTIAQPLLLHGTQETHLTMQHGMQATNVSMPSQTQNLSESEISHSLTNIPENSHSSASIKTETVVPSQGFQNHMDARDAPTVVNVQVSQELVSENLPVKGDANGEESETVSSGTSTVAIDNKIEQAMDLVKSHLMFAVREEVDVLKEKITELMDRISQLEYENGFLRANASQQTLEQLNQTQLLQQQQQQLSNQPSSVSVASTTSTQQLNFQNQQPTS